MPDQLLKCTVCPKSTSFSDISHLLTHVGSKGHLANLHKLQIRSQQQISAGQRLATYNQWFQEHGIAQLLSERMQQKEAKQAAKAAGNKRRAQAVKVAEEEDNKFSSYSSVQTCGTESGFNLGVDPIKSETLPEAGYPDLQTDTYTPVRRSSRLKIRNSLSPPCQFIGQESENELPAELDPQLTASPATPKLKGIVWPGMAMFDAADEDTKRKRNQRKDGSVLRRMERASALVQPFETVHSADGVALKERHMEELEDDSLVEGESPLMRSSPKRRTRHRNRTPSLSPHKPKKAKTRGRKHRSPTVPQRHKAKSSISSIGVSKTKSGSVVKDAVELSNLVHNSEYEKSNQNFIIYEDDKPLDVDATNPTDGLPNPFMDPDSNHQPYAVSPISYNSAPWLKSESQQSQAYDSFQNYQPMHAEPSKRNQIGHSKRTMPLATKSTNIPSQKNLNPLFWKRDISGDPTSAFAVLPNLLSDPFGSFHPSLNRQLDDPYSYGRNPLVGTLAHFGHGADFPEHNGNDREMHVTMTQQHHQLSAFSP